MARLVQSLCGARAAHQLWAKFVCGTLRELEYQETEGAPGVFWNPISGVDVNDFLVVGEEQDVKDLHLKMTDSY